GGLGSRRNSNTLTNRPNLTRSICSPSSPTRTWSSSPIRHRSRSRPSSRACPVKFFLFARDGYPPYGTTMVTTRGFVDRNPDVVALFVKASLEGWKSYITNPTPGNALIKADNPKMSDEQITFVIEQLKALKVLDGGDAQAMGIGIITEARWNATYDFRVAAG